MKSNQFLKEGFVEDASEVNADHEVQMARADLFHAAEDALSLHKLLRNVSEQQGLEGWVAAKITLASDYLKTVREYVEYQLMSAPTMMTNELPIAEGQQDIAEMDKSAPQPGRDGKVSHSTYGSRDKKGSDYFKGKEGIGRPITPKQMAKDALTTLKKTGLGENSSGEGYFAKSDYLDNVYRMLQDEGTESDVKRFINWAKDSGAYSMEDAIDLGTKVNWDRSAIHREYPRAYQGWERAIEITGYDPYSKPGNTINDPDDIRETQEDTPVANAIFRRLMNTKPDLFTRYGIEYVSDAVYDVADFVGDVEEIGTSDVSGWVRQVEQLLKDRQGSDLKETSAGSVAGVVNPPAKNKAKVGTLFGGTYKQKKTK